jgi:hypothetical protein
MKKCLESGKSENSISLLLEDGVAYSFIVPARREGRSPE